MKRIFLFLMLLSSVEGFSQSSGWFIPGTTPTTSTLNDIYIFDTDSAIAIGNNGTIIKTSDGGSSWNTLSSGTSINLNALHFVNSKIGWAVGRDRTILKTINGGETWTQQYSSMTGRHCYDVFFINADTGWVTCRDDWVGYIAIVYKTINGGDSWTSNITGVSRNFYSVYFSDYNTGWVLGSGGVVLKTTDGGSNWVSKLSGVSDRLTSISSVNDQLLFASG